MTRDGWQPCTCAVKKAGQVCHVKKAGQVSREGRLGRVPTDGAACAGLHPSSDAIAVVGVTALECARRLAGIDRREADRARGFRSCCRRMLFGLFVIVVSRLER